MNEKVPTGMLTIFGSPGFVINVMKSGLVSLMIPVADILVGYGVMDMTYAPGTSLFAPACR